MIVLNTHFVSGKIRLDFVNSDRIGGSFEDAYEGGSTNVEFIVWDNLESNHGLDITIILTEHWMTIENYEHCNRLSVWTVNSELPQEMKAVMLMKCKLRNEPAANVWCINALIFYSYEYWQKNYVLDFQSNREYKCVDFTIKHSEFFNLALVAKRLHLRFQFLHTYRAYNLLKNNLSTKSLLSW